MKFGTPSVTKLQLLHNVRIIGTIRIPQCFIVRKERYTQKGDGILKRHKKSNVYNVRNKLV